MTHPIKGIVAVSAAALLLSGCETWFTDDSSSSSTDDIVPEDVVPSSSSQTYDDQIIMINDLTFSNSTMSNTPGDQMPTSSVIAYEGVAGFSFDDPAGGIGDYDVMSDLSLEADFGTGAVTGSMDNFNTRDDVDLVGNLTLTEGEVQGTNFTANAIGSFTDGTTAELWDLDIVADFVGANGTAVQGTAVGSITNGGTINSEVFGDLIAQEN